MPVDGEKGVMVFMNVLNIEHVSKIFGDKKIFDDISYGIHDGDKIGIIGINGKSEPGSLREFGITYAQVDLLEDSAVD